MGVESIIFTLDNKPLLNSIVETMSHSRHYIETGKTNVQVFSDGETCVDFQTSMRGKRVYILSSPNTSLKVIQLMLAIDAAKRSSAAEIIPIIPYFPYARQDKRDQYRGPIGSKVMIKTLESLGATSFVTIDLHADQIEGFFEVPVIHIKGKYLFADYLTEIGNSNTVFCSPDAGGVKRVKKIRDLITKNVGINIPYVTIDKTRTGPNQLGDMTILGEVEGKDVIIIDDLCDTGGTLVKASNALLDAGAKSVRVLVTHAVMSGDAYNHINDSHIKEFICSDTLDTEINEWDMNGRMTEISINKILAKTIIGVNINGSVKSAR